MAAVPAPEPEPSLTDAAGGGAAEADPLAESREQAKAVLSLIQGFASADPGPGGDCSWCPVCRAARALRDGRPDVAEHLTDAVAAALAAVRALNSALDVAANPAPSAAKSDSEQSPEATN
jgi:hypothetical protein